MDGVYKTRCYICMANMKVSIFHNYKCISNADTRWAIWQTYHGGHYSYHANKLIFKLIQDNLSEDVHKKNIGEY